MTMAQTFKKMSAWDGILVPALGEVVIEQSTNKIKIGDGKTNFADLPYVDGNPPESQLSIGAKAFIEDHIELLENNDYETFYSLIKTTELAREVSKALFKAGLNPKEHLKECPRGCESIFYYEGKDDPNAKIKNRGWANINHLNMGKSWTMWDQKLESLTDYITGYESAAKETNILKELQDHLKSKWTLEDDE